MRILITGGTGFVGSSLARHLMRNGHTVTAFARPSDRATRLEKEGVRFVPGDLRDPAAVETAVRGQEAIMHLGAAYRAEGKAYQEFFDVNVGGTRNLMKAAERFDVGRIVHVSTTAIYGTLKEVPAKETHPIHPPGTPGAVTTDDYRDTKVLGERVALEAFAGPLAGRGVVMRPIGIYGPGDARVLKLVKGIAGGFFIRIGPCDNRYHPTFKDDAMDGFERALTHPNANGVYNIAGAEVVVLRDYIETIARLVGARPPRMQIPLAPVKLAAEVVGRLGRTIGVEPPLYPRRVGFFHLDRAYDYSRLSADTGFAPKVRLEEGLTQTIAWWRSQGMLKAAA